MAKSSNRMNALLIPIVGAVMTSLAAPGVRGQAATVVAVPVQPNGAVAAVATPVSSGALTQRQRNDLSGPAGPAPGVYRLRNLHSGQCLLFYPLASANNHAFKVPVPILGHLLYAGLSLPFVPPERAHFKQGSCQYVPPSGETPQQSAEYATQYAKLAEFWVLPHPQGGITIRSQQSVGQDERDPVPGQIGNCATVARNVILGAPRIDFLACDIEAGWSDWRHAGAADQRFIPMPRAGGNFTLRFGDNNCWALRNGSRDRGTDVLLWECTGGADQVYTFEFVRPVEQGTESGLFSPESWQYTGSGYRWVRGANGVGLQGTPYEQFETISDNGAYCGKRCSELDRCKAWTWNAAGYVVNSNDPPRCYWFDHQPTPVNRGEAEYSRVRSGYVR